MTTTRFLGALVAALFIGQGALAQEQELPEKYEKWLEQEVVYIISPREKDAFEKLESNEEREAFIEAFWRRRDPNPVTPVNEFREEHYRRIEYANRYLGRESSVPGWMTDRGKMYIILGEPRDREDFSSVPNLYPAELWFYDQNREKSLPPLYLLFFQQYHSGPYKLFNHFLDDPQDLMPARQFDPFEAPRLVYEMLQDVNPALAHSTITMRADQGVGANLQNPDRVGLDVQGLLSDIYVSPYRRVDTRYVDAANDSRGLVESEYLFNYVPSQGLANVLPGPGGTSFLHFAVEIEPQNMTLAFDEDRNTYYTSFEVRGELATIDETTIVDQFTKEPFIQLTPSQFRDVGSRPFAYRDMLPIVPGDFRFRLVLKNRARSEYTIFESEVSVPERGATDVFLGEPVPLYGFARIAAEDAGPENVYRTYRMGGVSLDPNAKRTIAIGNYLMAHVPLENVPDGSQLKARVVSADPGASDATLAEEDYPLDLYERPFVLRLPMSDTPGGRYRLDVELRSSEGAVIGRARTAFVVSPLGEIPRSWAVREGFEGEKLGTVRLALAEQSLRLERRDVAMSLLESALADDPNLVRVRVLLARFRLDAKNFDDAVRLLEPARAQAPDDVEVLLALGDAHFQRGGYKRAAELFEASLALRRPEPDVLNALALCHAQLGDTQQAIEYLKRSLAIQPEQSEIATLLEKLETSAPR